MQILENGWQKIIIINIIIEDYETCRFIGIIIAKDAIPNYERYDELYKACETLSIFDSETGRLKEEKVVAEEDLIDVDNEMKLLKGKINNSKKYTVKVIKSDEKHFNGLYTWVTIEEIKPVETE